MGVSDQLILDIPLDTNENPTTTPIELFMCKQRDLKSKLSQYTHFSTMNL